MRGCTEKPFPRIDRPRAPRASASDRDRRGRRPPRRQRPALCSGYHAARNPQNGHGELLLELAGLWTRRPVRLPPRPRPGSPPPSSGRGRRWSATKAAANNVVIARATPGSEGPVGWDPGPLGCCCGGRRSRPPSGFVASRRPSNFFRRKQGAAWTASSPRALRPGVAPRKDGVGSYER